MKQYLIIIAIASVLILFWYFNKSKALKLVSKVDYRTLSKTNATKYYERQVKNVYLASLGFIFWPLFDYSLQYLIGNIILTIIVYTLPISELKRNEREAIKRLKYDFPIWLRQIQILLQNNNVLTALELSLNSAPAIMYDDLEHLIMEIKNDATNAKPYYEFMKEYEIYEINRAMKLLYRYHMLGATDSYLQFQRMLDSTRKWLRQEREDKRKDQISLMNWIGLIPLLGATVMFMVLMIMVIYLMLQKGFASIG